MLVKNATTGAVLSDEEVWPADGFALEEKLGDYKLGPNEEIEVLGYTPKVRGKAVVVATRKWGEAIRISHGSFEKVFPSKGQPWQDKEQDAEEITLSNGWRSFGFRRP